MIKTRLLPTPLLLPALALLAGCAFIDGLDLPGPTVATTGTASVSGAIANHGVLARDALWHPDAAKSAVVDIVDYDNACSKSGAKHATAQTIEILAGLQNNAGFLGNFNAVGSGPYMVKLASDASAGTGGRVAHVSYLRTDAACGTAHADNGVSGSVNFTQSGADTEPLGGDFTITFSDGSTVAGSFSAVPCAAGSGAGACQ